MFKQIVLSFFLFLSSVASAMPKIGAIAPDIQTKEFKLSQAKENGKYVVLYFYPRDNTSNCTIEARKFAAYIDEFNKAGAIIVGISTDGEASHQKFKEENNLPFILISDNEKKIIKEYDVSGFIWTQRATFLIDPEGKIAYIWRSVNVAKHAEEVLEQIHNLKSQEANKSQTNK